MWSGVIDITPTITRWPTEVAVIPSLAAGEASTARQARPRLTCVCAGHLVLTNFGELVETGHPKWKQVDLDDIPPGWEVGNCVNRGLQATYRMNCDTGQMVVDTADDSEANAAYRQRICAVIGC
jgi:hypothetical protein